MMPYFSFSGMPQHKRAKLDCLGSSTTDGKAPSDKVSTCLRVYSGAMPSLDDDYAPGESKCGDIKSICKDSKGVGSSPSELERGEIGRASCRERV